MPVLKDKSVGIIVWHKFPRSEKFLLLKHKKGHWAFAKGHPDKGETLMQTALRELLEEAGIKKVEFISNKILLKDTYVFVNKNGKKVLKTVHYFIARSKTDAVKIDGKEITGYKWRTVKAARKILTYKGSKKILIKANKIINQN